MGGTSWVNTKEEIQMERVGGVQRDGGGGRGGGGEGQAMKGMKIIEEGGREGGKG